MATVVPAGRSPAQLQPEGEYFLFRPRRTCNSPRVTLMRSVWLFVGPRSHLRSGASGRVLWQIRRDGSPQGGEAVNVPQEGGGQCSAILPRCSSDTLAQCLVLVQLSGNTSMLRENMQCRATTWHSGTEATPWLHAQGGPEG